MFIGNRILKRVDIKDFLDQIKEYLKEEINCTNHTFYRFSEKQRKVYTCERLKEYLLYEEPILVGLQDNGNYAVFYRHEKGRFMRMIIDLQIRKINIVTFYFIDQIHLPRI